MLTKQNRKNEFVQITKYKLRSTNLYFYRCFIVLIDKMLLSRSKITNFALVHVWNSNLRENNILLSITKLRSVC